MKNTDDSSNKSKPFFVGLLAITFLICASCGGDGPDQSASAQQTDNSVSTFATADVSSIAEGAVEQVADEQIADEQVDHFNQVIISLLDTKRAYLRNTVSNQQSLNMLDTRLFANDFSLIYRASHGVTRNALLQYWSDAGGTDIANETKREGQLNDLENLYQSTASDSYEDSSTLWVQHDHLFK